MDHEYLPITGLKDFVESATELTFGQDSEYIKDDRIAALQSLSGTGSLRLIAQFIERFGLNGVKPTIMLPNPTWGNHFPIFEHACLETATYRYYDPETIGFDVKGMLEDISNAPPSVILLHACAHNPTGVDPSPEEWASIAEVVKAKGHFVIFDNAYQGFASGDTDKDIASVHQFLELGIPMAICQSFSKNFGLYGHRIGLTSIVCENKDEKERVMSHLKILARAMWSNPPIQGARLVAGVLSDPGLKTQWQGEIKIMADRIISMRHALKDGLKECGSIHNWDHITNQIGMFSFTGLNAEQCDLLMSKHDVYLTRNGRISMAGVSSENVKRLAGAIHDVTKDSPPIGKK